VPYSGQSDTQCGAGGLACSACTSDKFCNASGGCDVKNWCRTQTIPAGVASGDYQCLDFDSGMPPSNVWVPTVQSFGILELATDQVQSVPNALHARSVPTGGMTPAIPESIGQLAWGVSGALVSAVSITTDIYPLQLQGGAASRSDYLCLKIGALKGCLAYFDPNALGALSLVFPEGTSGPGTGYPVCDIGPTLDAPAAAWTRITLRLSSAGLLSLTIGTKTVPCSANLTVSSGVTAVQLGAHGVIEGDNYGDAHFYNVVTYVER
jgi:hypothetical protein